MGEFIQGFFLIPILFLSIVFVLAMLVLPTIVAFYFDFDSEWVAYINIIWLCIISGLGSIFN